MHGWILVYCVILSWSGWMPIYCHLDEVPCHFAFKTKVMFLSAPIITGKVGFNPSWSWNYVHTYKYSFFPFINLILFAQKICWLFHLETASECLFEFGIFTLWQVKVTYNSCIIWWSFVLGCKKWNLLSDKIQCNHIKPLCLSVKETMSTTMHLFTFYLESDGMSTNNDYKHFFGALSLQFC
jgi:hypothetical protein